MVRRFIGYGLFFFNDTATTEIYTLSLHDALPISEASAKPIVRFIASSFDLWEQLLPRYSPIRIRRSEEHTSELQSHSDIVCRLLLEKKKENPRVIRTPSIPITRLQVKTKSNTAGR